MSTNWTNRTLFHGDNLDFMCAMNSESVDLIALDHNTPRKDGGLNYISNRILLCSPCNWIKAHRFTLSGLQEENRKRGRMRA